MIRPARAAAAVVTLAFLPAISIAAQTSRGSIAYRPGSSRYRIVSVVTRSQEEGGQRDFRITNEQQISVDLSARGKDTLDFAYTLDSSSVVSEPRLPLPDVSKLVGTKVKGSMSTHGKVYEMTSNAPDNDMDARNLVEGMRKFLLPLPEDVAVGKSWTDTTVNTVSGDGGRLDMSAITTARVVGDTVLAGQRAWVVERTSVMTIHGTQTQAGQELKVEGDGSGNGKHYLGVNGTYLGSTATQRMNMRITVPAAGQTVPVTQVVTSTVERIR